MKTLPNTATNKALVQQFIDETKKRIRAGVDITFTQKAQGELVDLSLQYDITVDDIEDAIMNLTTDNYYRGIDPSPKTDFDVCSFYTYIGVESIGIYFKYGLEVDGLQILIFSNHAPMFPMNQPFKN